MKFTLLVLFPALVQVLLGLAVMSLRKPGGEFVGLGVMLLGMVAIPLTALVNWARTRSAVPLSALQLAARTFFTSLVFPVLCIALYVLAS
jgi:hypothetical protein